MIGYIGYALGILAVVLDFFILPCDMKTAHCKSSLPLIMAIVAIVLIANGI